MSLSQQVLERVMAFIPVVLSLSVHEWAHARAASWLGDDTAKEQGRLTLNPLAHLDVVGTIALPLLGIPFGWAKPVPVEPTRFRSSISMTRGMLITAMAGPTANVILVFVCAALLRCADHAGLSPYDDELLEAFLGRAMVINIVLALFNLLPIPPLDGSRLVDAFAPFEYRSAAKKVGAALGFVLVVVLMLPLLPHGESVFAWIVRNGTGLAG